MLRFDMPRQRAASDPERVPAAFTFPVRVYYEDTDAAGVVYYANYLRFFERARTEWLVSLGHSPAELARTHGIVFVVRRVDATFRAPAHLEDALDVTVALATLGRASLGLRQDVLRDDTVLVSADVELACVGTNGLRPARIPADVWHRLSTLAKDPS